MYFVSCCAVGLIEEKRECRHNNDKNIEDDSQADKEVENKCYENEMFKDQAWDKQQFLHIFRQRKKERKKERVTVGNGTIWISPWIWSDSPAKSHNLASDATCASLK